MRILIKSSMAILLGIICLLPANVLCADPATPRTNETTAVSPEDLLWSSAQESLRKERHKEARELFAQFARQYSNDPRNQEALFYQGLCEMRSGQETQAWNTWDLVLRREMPEKTKSRTWLSVMEQMAIWHGWKTQEENRKKDLKQLVAVFPDDPVTVRLHTQAAEERLKKSDYSGALTYYRAVESNLNENDRKNMKLAETVTGRGPKPPDEILAAAHESFEKDNVEQAIGLYKFFLKQYPGSPLCLEARTRLGWSYYTQGKWEKSEALWREVIKQGSARDEWVGRSRWHIIQLLAGPAGKPDQALELCEIQAKAFPNDPQGERALFTRAWLYWTKKNWVKGKAAFDDLIAAYPGNALDPPVQEYMRDCETGMRKERK